jgi:hypothetical protein
MYFLQHVIFAEVVKYNVNGRLIACTLCKHSLCSTVCDTKENTASYMEALICKYREKNKAHPAITARDKCVPNNSTKD